MKLTGYFLDAQSDVNGLTATFKINERYEGVAAINKLSKDIKYDITLERHRIRRGKDANALMWCCLQEMAEVLNTDKWSVYLQELRRYGVFTYIAVKPEAVKRVSEAWRESEVIGMCNNGDIEMLCYFGSSTYSTKEFSHLLEGIISDMKEMDLTPPLPADVEICLKEWERKQNAK